VTDDRGQWNRRRVLKYLVVGGTVTLIGGIVGAKLSWWESSSVSQSTSSSVSQSTSSSVSQSTSSSVSQSTPVIDAYELITQALVAGERKVYLPSGNYSVSKSILVNMPNVEIYGDGKDATVLRLNDNVLADALYFQRGANGFYVHDLQLDGNKLNQLSFPGAGGSININGIDAWNCSNGIVENCFIHDSRVFGIAFGLCSNCKVLNNLVQNSDANGITISNQHGGSGNLVQGNVVDGASDVGITGWDAVDYTVQQNIVKNVTLSTSPFGNNSHIGILAEGSPNGTGSKNCTYSENTVSNVLGSGMYSSPANATNSPSNQNEDIVFESNTIQNCGMGITVNHTIGFTGTSNLIDGITNVRGWAIQVGPDASSVVFTGNQLEGVPASMSGAVVQLGSPTGIFKNNTIYANGNDALYVKYKNGWVVSPNTIVP